MEFRQLRYFVEVAATLSFTSAAKRLYVAQSALSHQVGQLEKELGVSLLDRSTRRMRLTEAGAVFRRHATRVLYEIDQSHLAMDEIREVISGHLRVGLIQAMTCLFDMAALLGEFHHRYPQIQLTVSDQGSHQMVDAVRSGELDVAFVGLHTDELPSDIAGRLLVVDPVVAVIHDDRTVNVPVSLRDLALQYEFLEFRSATGLRSRVDAAFTTAGVPRASRFELGQLENLVRFAANGLGVALVPASVAAHYIGDDTSTKVAPLVEPIVHPISVIFSPPQPSAPSARAFLDLLESRPL